MFGQSRSVDAKFEAWLDLLERAEPEVLHAVFPAAQIQAYDVVGPLQEDPPSTYRSIRLDKPPRFS